MSLSGDGRGPFAVGSEGWHGPRSVGDMRRPAIHHYDSSASTYDGDPRPCGPPTPRGWRVRLAVARLGYGRGGSVAVGWPHIYDMPRAPAPPGHARGQHCADVSRRPPSRFLRGKAVWTQTAFRETDGPRRPCRPYVIYCVVPAAPASKADAQPWCDMPGREGRLCRRAQPGGGGRPDH